VTSEHRRVAEAPFSWHHHSAVGLVDRLVTKRLAVRERSTTDRRRVLVRLTPQGIRLVERVSARTEMNCDASGRG